MYNEVKRGEIFYVEIPYATGHEMEKDRPGIIVSCDELNKNSPVVAVVMCSASSKRELPEHITIRSTPVQSTALCEHIYTVDRSRLDKWVGRCSKAEMAAVDIGIMSGLGLGAYDLASHEEASLEEPQGCDTGEANGSILALVRAEAERDTYKGLCESLMGRMSMEWRTGA